MLGGEHGQMRCHLLTTAPHPLHLTRGPPFAGDRGDLHSFDPATMTWTLLSAVDGAGRPSARNGHGFTSAGGLLYVHGGIKFDVYGHSGKLGF